MVLLNVAFFTLIERKILGLSQIRKGPNKVSIWGLGQPFADAIKLFSKERGAPFLANKIGYICGPVLGMFCILILWRRVVLPVSYIDQEYRIIFILTIMTIGSYPLILIGWSSGRKYALVGSLRGVAQTISYEIRFALVFLSVLVLVNSLEIKRVVSNSKELKIFFFVLPLLVIWIISCVAERNRTPFDFSEGERELVSGFNIEYGSFIFAVIFITEYGIILFLSIITGAVFGGVELRISLAILICGIAFWWVWIRCTFPRYRYDKLINLAWKSLLPGSLRMLIYFLRFF